MTRWLRRVAAVALGLFAVVMVIVGPVGFVEALASHQEDGGRAKVDHPRLGQSCFRTGCVNDRELVDIEFRDGETEEVEDIRLYDRARSEGPFFVQVRRLSGTHTVTQLREDGHWRVIAPGAKAGDAATSVLVLVIGVVLLFLALGVWPSGAARSEAESLAM